MANQIKYKEVTKFSETAYHEAAIIETRPYKLIEQINSGVKLDRNSKNYITELCHKNTYFSDSMALYGWRLCFSRVLKRFLVNNIDYSWTEYFACDKTSLMTILSSKPREIIEISNK